MTDYLQPEVVDDGALQPFEQEELVRCEEVIRDGIKDFFRVGVALTKIRDLKLYRETNSTFEDYCKARWDFSRQHGYALIAAARTVEIVSEVGPMPQNERQIRSITKLEEEQQRNIWRRALDIARRQNDGVVTTSIVEHAIKQLEDEAYIQEEKDENRTMNQHAEDEEWIKAHRQFARLVAKASVLQRDAVKYFNVYGGDPELDNLISQLTEIWEALTAWQGVRFGKYLDR